jgi:hypothetical protein
MAAELQHQSNIDRALSQYNQIRSQYGNLLNQAITTEDPAKKAELVPTITAMNQQLSTIVASIQQMYQDGQATLSSMPPINFAGDLDKFKRDMDELMAEKDEVTRLKIIQSTLSPTQNYNYIYVVAILIMLIVLLVMFTFSFILPVPSLPSLPSLPTLPTLPTLPSLPELPGSTSTLGTSLGT